MQERAANPGRGQKNASVVLCAEADSSASAVQSTKFILLMTENDGHFFFSFFSCFLTAVQPIQRHLR